ncbi:MAG: AAA family ATPase [Planctomycetaceae bacterium]
MRVTGIQIEQFGVWHDLNLPLTSQGLSSIYGPNEAGKSTLMRFVRGILFGFRTTDERSAGPDGKFRRCSGALRVECNGVDYEIRRESHPGTRGRLTINGSEHGGKADERLQRLLANTKEALFENVFAIGLEELQQLATLTGEEVAQHIYGLSLGSHGRRILAAQHAANREVNRLANMADGSGVMHDLSQQIAKVDEELDRVHDKTDHLSDLADERMELYEQIEGLKKRQVSCERNIRGAQFIDRLFPVWRKQRDLKRELDGLPNVNGLSEDALDRYDEIELELEEVLGERNRFQSEAQELEEQAEQSELDATFEEQVCAIRTLMDRQEDVRKVEKRIEERKRARDQRKLELQAALSALQAEVPWDSLERFDSSPGTLSSLLSAGEKYRQSAWMRSRSIKRYRAAQKAAQARAAEFAQRSKGLEGRAIEDAADDARRQLDSLEELQILRAQEERLAHTEAILQEQMKEFPRRRELPDYFYIVLWVLGVGGVVLFLYGVTATQQGSVRGENTAWIIGLIYMLIGVCCGAFTYTLNDHYRQFLSWDPSRVRRRLEDIQNERERALREIRRMIGKDPILPRHLTAKAVALPRADEPEQLKERDIITLLRERAEELDSLHNLERKVIDDRERLSRYRERLQMRQRIVSTMRREWTDLLRRLNLQESLKVTEAFDVWQQIAEIQRAWVEWQNEAGASQRDEAIVREYREEVIRVARALNETNPRQLDPHELVAIWDVRLQEIDVARRERKRLLNESRQKRRDADRLESTIDTLRARRLAMLSRAGAADRAELATRIQSVHRRIELLRLLEDLRGDLDGIVATEPDLAIVEDDLNRFDVARNKEYIAKNRSEMKAHDDQIQSLHQRLGQIKREIEQIEEDESLESLSRKRKRLALDLRDATSRWVAARLAGNAIEKVRHRVERNCQPDTLKLASDYLDRLTCGKYVNVWAPLGEKHLVIDDEHGTSFQVGHLSSGTREQLFLAVRMAMIRELADQGVELPMVLDDVFVNFDQERTEAAVETLMDFADDGQQVLFFSCHLHLAQMFEDRGTPPIYLPGHAPAMAGIAP